jgi:hypothetical protein
MQRRIFLQLSLLAASSRWAWAKSSKTVLPVHTGDSGAAVVKLLKQPTSKGKEILEAATGLLVQDWNFPKLGLTLKMGRPTKKDPLKVESILAVAPCPYVTDKLVGIGDTAKSVKQAYSASLSAESTPEILVVGSIYGGTMFSIKKGKVVQIFIGAAAE